MCVCVGVCVCVCVYIATRCRMREGWDLGGDTLRKAVEGCAEPRVLLSNQYTGGSVEEGLAPCSTLQRG